MYMIYIKYKYYTELAKMLYLFKNTFLNFNFMYCENGFHTFTASNYFKIFTFVVRLNKKWKIGADSFDY